MSESESETDDAFVPPRAVPTLPREGTAWEGTTLDDWDDYQDRAAFRAWTGLFVVVPEVDADGTCVGLYRVFSGRSRSEYQVKLPETVARFAVDGACNCPAFENITDEAGDPEPCKHLHRVVAEVNKTPLPATGEDASAFWLYLADRRERMATLADTLDTMLATTAPELARIDLGHKRRSLRAFADALDALLTATTEVGPE